MKSVRIEDVSEFVLDGTHGSPVRTESGIPVLSAQNVRDGVLNFETDRYTSPIEYEAFNNRIALNRGDFLLTIVGTIGRAAIITDVRPLVFQRSVAVIRPKSRILWPKFLLHASQTQEFQSQLLRSSNKSSQAGVYLGKLKEVTIPLPPLNEQRRIADVLDRAEELLTKRRAALDLLDKLTQAIFLDMFGDPVTNPKGLLKVPLGNLIKLRSGEFLPATQMSPTGAFPVFGGNGINGYHNEFLLEERQIIVGRVGAYCGCVHVSPPRSWVTDNALYVCERKADVEFEYLVFALIQANLNQYSNQSGQPLVSGSRIYPVEILVPPLPLQKTFAARIAAIDSLKQKHKQAELLTQNLFQSLQHKAFRGEL